MKKSLSILASCAAALLPSGIFSMAQAANYPVSSKGAQATVVAKSGIDSDSASVTGQVLNADLHEYCDRDPGGMTTRYGGKMTLAQCVAQMAREVGGKKYSSYANCRLGLVTSHWGKTYKLVSRAWSYGSWDYVWRDKSSGVILDGSNASRAPTVTSIYKLLCPSR